MRDESDVSGRVLMAAKRIRRKMNIKIQWTDKMNDDLLECKQKALDLVKSSNPPRLDSGRKKGYMAVMKDLWETMGYSELGLSSQNLRDQAQRLEKIQDRKGEVVRNDIRLESTGNRMDRSESLVNNNSHDLEAEADLHMEDMTAKSNSVPKRPIAINSFVKEALKSTTVSAHMDCGIKTSKISPNLPQFDVCPSEIKAKMWGNICHQRFCEEINNIYNEVVHFRRNIFNLPSGGAGKHFIEELTFWLKQFNSNSDLNSVALKAFMVLPSVILQKPSATSKTKEHSVAIERRLALWRQGDLNMLMKEIRFIQDRFVNSKRARSVEDISTTFAKLVFQGKITAAIKLLDRENSSGLLNLSDKVLAQLKEKHPVPAEIEEECLLHGPVDLVPPGIFEVINEQRIFDSALKTKGSAGPSGMDAELYRRILCSKNFAAEGKTLREEIATLTRNLLKFNYHPSLLEGYTACRLIPLDKNPGVRPIGVGEVLRRIIGKTTSAMFKEEIKEAVGPLQVCAGHSAGSEAAIHAITNQVFNEEGADGVLLIDATNAFNQMNRAVAMHNIRITCKEIASYIINTYRSPSRLFISGGGEIFSQEGTTQGDPLAMPWYAINTYHMISSLRALIPQVKQVWLADDSAGGGSIESLYQWYKSLCEEGKKLGYIVNGAKSWLIVKNSELAESAKKVFGDDVNITLEGRRHLGAVIGSK